MGLSHVFITCNALISPTPYYSSWNVNDFVYLTQCDHEDKHINK